MIKIWILILVIQVFLGHPEPLKISQTHIIKVKLILIIKILKKVI